MPWIKTKTNDRINLSRITTIKYWKSPGRYTVDYYAGEMVKSRDHEGNPTVRPEPIAREILTEDELQHRLGQLDALLKLKS